MRQLIQVLIRHADEEDEGEGEGSDPVDERQVKSKTPLTVADRSS